MPDYGEPRVPVGIGYESGVVLTLGTFDCQNRNFPNLFVERYPGGWMIQLSHRREFESGAYACLLDNGRSCFHPGFGPNAIRMQSDWDFLHDLEEL